MLQILIVEDDKELSQLFQKVLEKNGYQVKSASDGAQAGLHGNEPAGPEAACMLADYLLNTPEGAERLKKVSLALVPIANTDGYAMQIGRAHV